MPPLVIVSIDITEKATIKALYKSTISKESQIELQTEYIPQRDDIIDPLDVIPVSSGDIECTTCPCNIVTVNT